MEFIRELISERWIKVRIEESTSLRKEMDLWIPHGRVLNIILFLVAINSILEELGNGLDKSIFADNLTMYITTRNQKVATRVMKVRCMTVERGLIFSTSITVNIIFRKRNKEPMEITLKKPNHIMTQQMVVVYLLYEAMFLSNPILVLFVST